MRPSAVQPMSARSDRPLTCWPLVPVFGILLFVTCVCVCAADLPLTPTGGSGIPENTAVESSSSPPPQAPSPMVPSPAPSALPSSTDVRTAASVAPLLVVRNEFLTEDTHWRGDVRVEGGVTVAPQTTLTLAPGTVVRFAGEGGALLILGRLVARGTPDRPILFAPASATTSETRWQGLVFLGTDKKNILEQCRIEGATTAVDASFATLTMNETRLYASATGLRCQDCLLAVTGGGIERCGLGVSLVDSEADLRTVVMRENTRGIVASRSSLYLTASILEGHDEGGLVVEGGRLVLSANTIRGNGSGLTLGSCEGTVSANRVADNRGHGVHLAKARVRVEGNSIEGNNGNGLEVEDGAAVAWGNSLASNGGYDCINSGTDDFRAIANWWGGKDAAVIAARIFDRQADGRKGRVFYLPVLDERPARLP